MGNVLKAHALRYAQCTFKYLEKIVPGSSFSFEVSRSISETLSYMNGYKNQRYKWLSHCAFCVCLANCFKYLV